MTRSDSLQKLILVTAAILTGCGGSATTSDAPHANVTPEVTPAPQAAQAVVDNPLADTDWQLVEFQSMDDAQGTTQPDDPSLYTMRLNADGTVTMRLNCNRANGSWSFEPSADPTNGRFEFGPLAVTRALCPPPSMDELVAAQAEYVRGFLLKEGRLYLSLMADGGIFAWEPTVPFVAEADPMIEAAMLEASPDYTREIVGIDGREARYVFSRIDLDGDGRDEIFVYPMGSIFCGSGGCTLFLFTENGDGLGLVDSFPISRLPFIVSEQTTNGWRNLVRRESGGGAPPSWVLHTFDGEQYIESERMTGDAAAPAGTWCLTGEVSYDNGVALEPQS